MMRTAHDEVKDDLAALVAGEPDAIARHADHLASCDECRDARHEATKLAEMIGDAGSDYVAPADLVDRVLAKAEVKPEPKPLAAKPKASEPEIRTQPAPVQDITSARGKRKLWIVAGAAAALA